SDRIPAEVRDLVASATAKDPAQRPTTAGDFGHRALALAASLAGGESLPVRPVDAADTVLLPPVLLSASSPGPLPDEEGPEGTRVMRPVSVPGGAAVPAVPAVPASAARRNRSGLIRLLFVLAIIAAIIAVALLGHSGGGGAPKPTPTTSRATPTAVSFDRNAYLGRPYAEVAAALTAKGLVPKRQTVSNASTPDTVVDIGNGPFRSNDVVTVTVSTGPAATQTAVGNGTPGEKGPGGKDHKKGKD
ncbi:MAG: eukaryotic-like serine/threonine-protein kinase, partial [Frankiaceae bacterium]|nr:eukaryotic-like serine/threonine-protein kinase [Frankiaceae bacterium]